MLKKDKLGHLALSLSPRVHEIWDAPSHSMKHNMPGSTTSPLSDPAFHGHDARKSYQIDDDRQQKLYDGPS